MTPSEGSQHVARAVTPPAAVTVHTRGGEHFVTHAKSAGALPPVLLRFEYGCTSFQDYLTPEQARTLAAALIAQADYAERSQ